jgi:hypothetical protein
MEFHDKDLDFFNMHVYICVIYMYVFYYQVTPHRGAKEPSRQNVFDGQFSFELILQGKQ